MLGILRGLAQINILVSSGRRAILTDFGSARRVNEAKPDAPSSPDENGDEAVRALNITVDEVANTMTITSGDYTLRWAAPEVLAEEDTGTEADIWSFGWVCSEVGTVSNHLSPIITQHTIGYDRPHPIFSH